MKTIRVVALVLVAAMAFGVVGSAAAQGPGGRQSDDPRPQLRGEVFDAVVEALHMEAQDVLDRLRGGETLTEILADKGLDAQAFLDDVKQTLTDEINAALADGDLTQARADALLAQLDDALQRVMTATLSTPIRDRIADRLDDTLFGVLAEAAGVEPGDLLRDILTPPSLADVAAQYGLDADTLISTTEARITEDVNQAVADGKLTQEQADQMLDGLHDRLVERFNGAFHPLRSLRDRREARGMQTESGLMFQ